MRHFFQLVTVLCAGIFLACMVMAATPAGQARTVEGVVDGQKFGTNVLGGGLSVNFEGDSEMESRLLKACATGVRCKVVVITGKGDVVLKLISAERVSVPTQTNRTEPVATSSGPSFSCEKASTVVERSICANPTLSYLDRELAAVYRRKLEANAIERNKIQQEQRSWMSKERDVCQEAFCLQAAYKSRLEYLAR